MSYEADEERVKFYPPTDFSLPENQTEKQKLLQEVVLPAVQRRLDGLREGLNYDALAAGEDHQMDYEGMRAEIKLALETPLAFVKKVSGNGLKHFDAEHMVSKVVTEEEATQLVESALTKLSMTRQQLQNL